MRDGDSDKHAEFLDAMKSVGGSQFYYDDLDTAFERYRTDYKKAFGKDAPTVGVVRV